MSSSIALVRFKSTHKWYRLCYVGITACALVLVAVIPGTLLWYPRRRHAVKHAEVIFLVVAVALSVTAFASVQGSDPGYLYRDSCGDSEAGPEKKRVRRPLHLRSGCDSADGAGDCEDDLGDEGSLNSTPQTITEASSPSGVDPPGRARGFHAGRPLSRMSEARTRSGGQEAVPNGEYASLAKADSLEGAEVDSLTTALLGRDLLLAQEAPGDTFAPGDVEHAAYLLIDSVSRNMNARVGSTRDFRRCRRCDDMKVPLRSHHCRLCDRCVATFDHHCSLLGTCVGERNHFRYWWFLLAHTGLLADVLRIVTSGFVRVSSDSVDSALHQSGAGTAISGDIHDASPVGATTLGETVWAGTGEWLEQNYLALVASLCLWPCFIVASLLLLLHSYLALSGLTTYECLREGESPDFPEGTRRVQHPFNQGLLRNLVDFCCMRDRVCWLLSGRAWYPKRWRTPMKAPRRWRDPWQRRRCSCC